MCLIKSLNNLNLVIKDNNVYNKHSNLIDLK